MNNLDHKVNLDNEIIENYYETRNVNYPNYPITSYPIYSYPMFCYPCMRDHYEDVDLDFDDYEDFDPDYRQKKRRRRRRRCRCRHPFCPCFYHYQRPFYPFFSPYMFREWDND